MSGTIEPMLIIAAAGAVLTFFSTVIALFTFSRKLTEREVRQGERLATLEAKVESLGQTIASEIRHIRSEVRMRLGERNGDERRGAG